MVTFSGVCRGITQLFDFYSDLLVLYVIYMASLEPENMKSESDYQTALFICFISIAGTFMAMQSCIIGIKFGQGDFEP